MSNSARSAPPLRAQGTPMPPLAEVLAGRRLLLTGTTGFLGKVLLFILLRDHPEIGRIYVVIRGDRRSSQSRFQREIATSPVMGQLVQRLGERFKDYLDEKVVVLPGDIGQVGLATDGKWPQRGEVDAVIHCAGLVNFEASLEKALVANTLGVANVIDFCRQVNAALIHVSTCYVAGKADGHRYEDELPEDWCPNESKGHFSVRREIQDARATIDRIEAASREQRHHPSHRRHDDQSTEAGAEVERKRWVEERLRKAGLKRSLAYGWPNTYSYTKSLAEQLVLAARAELAVTVVRPAVIESALADPFPGWNQGVNTSAPLTYLSGEGFRFYPARSDLVLDVIPVDLVVHAMVPILAALLLRQQASIYQLGTSDCNPLPMRRLVELTGLSNRIHQRDGNGSMGRLAAHLEAIVVSQSTYELASRVVPDLLSEGARLAEIFGMPRAAALRRHIGAATSRLRVVRSLVSVYRPYIQELVYTFHCRNIRRLYKRLTPADAELHPFDPQRIDWQRYWIDIHMPGLRRYSFPQLDLHTRARVRVPTRHRNLLEMLERSAEKFPNHAALAGLRSGSIEFSLSYRELRERAARAGLLLISRGVKPGDRVLLGGENSPHWVIAFFAILYAGAVAVPLDHQITVEEAASISGTAQPAAALLSPPVHRRLAAVLNERHPGLRLFELHELERPFLLRGAADHPPPPDRKTLAAIFFTSGSTGSPKGVMLTHGNLTAELAMLLRVFTLRPDDMLLSLLPLHHTFEFTCGMLLPVASASQVVYPLEFEPTALGAVMASVRPTAMIGVPALWQAIHRRINDYVEARGTLFKTAFDHLLTLNRTLTRDLGVNAGAMLFRSAHQALGGRLRLAVSGGAALPIRTAEFFHEIGINLVEGYGLTEAAPVLSVASPDESNKPGSVGKPLSGVEIRLEGAGSEGVGEILARGANVMAGYFHDPAATEAALVGGWLHTGDLGRFDQDGALYIVGRAKEVIVDAGGNNIYIDQLEEIYGHSPYLKELAIVGISTPGGEQVAALAVPAYARGQSRRNVEDQLQAHFAKVGAKLPSFKRIKILRFTDAELPRTRTRKIKRGEVVAILRGMIEGEGTPETGGDASRDLEPWVIEALAQVSATSLRISAATRLIEDLGLDSLALAELAEHVEERSGLGLTPQALVNLKTAGDLQQMVAESQARPRLPSYSALAHPYSPQLPQALRSFARAVSTRAQNSALDKWLRPRVLGRGNLPANRNLLVIANHSSHLDFALVMYALGPLARNIVVLAARDYFFDTPLRRFLVSNFSALIPFDRQIGQIDSLEDALDQLRRGRSVLMFPEGTRSPDGVMQEFRSGAGYLALRAECDILPVYIAGSHAVLPKGSLLPRRRPVEVHIGRVIRSETLHDLASNGERTGAYRMVARFLQQAVSDLKDRKFVAPARYNRAGTHAGGRNKPA